MNNLRFTKNIIKITIFSLLLVEVLTPLNYYTVHADPVVRGLAGDFVADVQVGKRDFTEISLNKTVDYKVYNPGGVTIDNSVPEGRMYVWDSGNNRVLGYDLATLGSAPYHADIVLGQPATNDYGACNGDSSFINDPTSSIPSASTLCGMPDYTRTVGEDKTFSNMVADSAGNLYVPDIMNNRVLKYYTPFTVTGTAGSGDSVADEVWGQPNFNSGACNLTMVRYGSFPAPTANSLCFSYWDGSGGGGVALDASGNLWIADSLNNRILRYPNVSGTISKTANLVIGQTNFTTGANAAGGNALNKTANPQSLDFDSTGNLFVADTGNARVMRYATPQSTNMSGTVFLDNTADISPEMEGTFGAVKMNSAKTRLFTQYLQGFSIWVDEWNLNSTKATHVGTDFQAGGGGIGVDLDDNVYFSDYVYGQAVYQRLRQPDTSYISGVTFFADPAGGYNDVAFNRLNGPQGVAIIGDRMYVSDGRLLFWDNKDSIANGQDPDGYLNASTGVEVPHFSYVQLKSDLDGRLWATSNNQYDGSRIEMYQGTINSADTPDLVLTGNLNVVGGGTIAIQNTIGIAVSPHSEYVWISETLSHRVFRIKNPLTSPVVDVILGQTDTTGVDCNRGLSGWSNVADLSYLCYPGYLSLDNYQNLYVSDHFLEVAGNIRLLMFTAATFPDNLVSPIFAPDAVKSTPSATFEAAFDSENRMVMGYNPYLSDKHIHYYNDPEVYNPSDAFDADYNQIDGIFKDYYGWPQSMVFDSDGNLYVGDSNRGKVLVYYKPFAVAGVLSQVTPVPSPTTDKTPNYTFSTTVGGTLTYGGSCSSSTTTVPSGSNTITFNSLSAGIYSNCTIRLRDSNSVDSNILAVNTFTISFKPFGDYNMDSKVDLSDLSILATYWQTNNTAADSNNDGTVDLSDLSILAQNWLANF